MNSNVMDLRNLIQGFKLSCQTEGKSPKTIEWYTTFLQIFSQFLEKNNLPYYDVSLITKNHIREFVRYLQIEARTPHGNKSLAPATIQGYVRTLKAFFSWVIREDYLDLNPMLKIPTPKATIKIINTFSDEQISLLCNLCSTSNGTGYRDLSIFLLLLDSGLRVSELINLDLDDLVLSDGYLRVRHGKGNKERVVPIGSVVQKTLWKYINYHRPKPLTNRVVRLFLSEYRLPLTKSGVQQMLRRYGKRAGITGVRCSPHTFRHTFAKNYLLNGGDIFSLQRILGHSSLASVRIYINLFASDIKAQHRRFSPVDNLTESRGIRSSIHSRGYRKRRV